MRSNFRNVVFVVALALAALPVVAFAATHHQSLTPLESRIRTELVTLPYYSIFDNFEFRVDGSKVTLSGQVNRPTLKSAAERVVSRVEGVSNVDNQIEVLPVSFHDDRIRRAVLYSIYRHPVLDRYALRSVGPIHIIVKNGNVALEGVVARDMESQVAFLQANRVPGVFGVTNNLRVENPRKR